MVWGLDEFPPVRQRARDTNVIFAPEDCYTEPVLRNEDDEVDAFSLSLFLFPLSILEDAIGTVHTGTELLMRLPMNIYHRESDFHVKLIRVSAVLVLGAIAQLPRVSVGSQSGFQLASPSDGKRCMIAIYPPTPILEGGHSLDYS